MDQEFVPGFSSPGLSHSCSSHWHTFAFVCVHVSVWEKGCSEGPLKKKTTKKHPGPPSLLDTEAGTHMCIPEPPALPCYQLCVCTCKLLLINWFDFKEPSAEQASQGAGGWGEGPVESLASCQSRRESGGQKWIEPPSLQTKTLINIWAILKCCHSGGQERRE